MKTTEINKLKAGDKFKFTENGRTYEMVTSNWNYIQYQRKELLWEKGYHQKGYNVNVIPVN